MLIYLSRYWHFVDRDNNGSLDFFEFRKFWTDMTDVVVQRTFQVYDLDKDDVIAGDEMTQLTVDGKFYCISYAAYDQCLVLNLKYNSALKYLKSQNINFTLDEMSNSRQILQSVDTDGNLFSTTKIEFMRYNVKMQAYFMETGAI